jgi:hypothetical protein
MAAHHQISGGDKRRGFVCSSSPDFAVGHYAAEDLASFGAWTRIVHRDGFTASQIALRRCRRAWPLRFVLLCMHGNRSGDDEHKRAPNQ